MADRHVPSLTQRKISIIFQENVRKRFFLEQPKKVRFENCAKLNLHNRFVSDTHFGQDMVSIRSALACVGEQILFRPLKGRHGFTYR